MADYAGAAAAIEARLTANWTTTPIAFENEKLPSGIIGSLPNRALNPWVLCEVVGEDGEIVGAGKPGDHVNRLSGTIEITVFVPVDSKRATARGHAVAIGEIFRNQEFYQSAGACVRTWVPWIGGGRRAKSENPDGNWWALPLIVPFEFINIG